MMLQGAPDTQLDDGFAPLREPPHNIEAEQALLGCVLINNASMDRVGGLEPHHLFDPLHQQIFEVARKLISTGRRATPITLKTFFDGAPPIRSDLTVPQYLGSLAGNATTIINVADYARLIRDLATRRALILIGSDVVNDAFDADLHIAPDEQIAEAEKRLSELAVRSDDDRACGFDVALTEAIEYANEAYQRKGHLAGLSTGLEDLDAKLGGLAKTDLVILAGRPSMGKTALATHIAWSTAKDGLPVLFYSLEMDRSQIAMRIAASEIEVGSEKLRRGMVSEDEIRALVTRAEDIGRCPLHIDDRGGISMGQLAARARRAARKTGAELMVVDYIQLLSGSKRARDGRVQEVTEITTGLKALAKELQIPVIALSQLSRGPEGRPDKRPQLSDLRESGSIEQDADVVMFVYRDEYYVERRKPDPSDMEKMAEWERDMRSAAGKAEVIIGKQRHGPTGVVPLAFDGALTRFSDMAPEYREARR